MVNREDYNSGCGDELFSVHCITVKKIAGSVLILLFFFVFSFLHVVFDHISLFYLCNAFQISLLYMCIDQSVDWQVTIVSQLPPFGTL